MPLECLFDVEPCSKSQFYEMDHLVMHHAFEIQNELGRFYDESIYQKELVRRCTDAGLSVVSEGEMIVSCDSFKKSYYLDALINSGSICELKAVEARRAFEMNDEAWQTEKASGAFIKDVVRRLIQDWGLFFDVCLYREAIHYFFRRRRPVNAGCRCRDWWGDHWKSKNMSIGWRNLFACVLHNPSH